MKYVANLVGRSLDKKTAQYAVSFGNATVHIDVHSNGRTSATNFIATTAKIIASELCKRYVAAQGNWPQTHKWTAS